MYRVARSYGVCMFAMWCKLCLVCVGLCVDLEHDVDVNDVEYMCVCGTSPPLQNYAPSHVYM